MVVIVDRRQKRKQRQPRRTIMKIGARNQLVGEIVEVKRGAVMGEVKLTIPARSPMASVMTLESIDDLELKPGDQVRVVVKAIHVLLIKD
jgi:molybdate transport system regulatory protein